MIKFHISKWENSAKPSSTGLHQFRLNLKPAYKLNVSGSFKVFTFAKVVRRLHHSSWISSLFSVCIINYYLIPNFIGWTNCFFRVFLNSRKKDWRTWVSLNDNTKVQFKGNRHYTNKWKLVWWNKTVSDENILLLPFKNT